MQKRITVPAADGGGGDGSDEWGWWSGVGDGDDLGGRRAERDGGSGLSGTSGGHGALVGGFVGAVVAVGASAEIGGGGEGGVGAVGEAVDGGDRSGGRVLGIGCTPRVESAGCSELHDGSGKAAPPGGRRWSNGK